MTAAAITGAIGSVVSPRRRALVGAGLLAAMSPVVELAAPWPVAVAVDQVIDGRSATGVLAVLAVLAGLGPSTVLAGCAAATLGLAGVGALLDYLTIAHTERTCERIGADLRLAVFHRAVGLSLRFHDRTRSGELVSRLTSDVGRILDGLTSATLVLLADGMLLVGAVVVLAAVDPPLALVALVVIPPLAAIAVVQRRRVRGAQQVARAEAGRLAAAATELLRNVRAIQVFSRNGSLQRRFDTRNHGLLRANLRAVQVEAGWAPRADLVLAVGTAAALLVGVMRVHSGAITTGTLILLLAYVRDLYRPVRSLAKLASTFAKAAASARRLEEVLGSAEHLPDEASAPPAPPLASGISFDDVRFGYDSTRPVVRGLDLWLPAGTITVVTGPSGTGKSTLFQLLLRLYDVDAGSITLDGVDIRSYSLESVRSRIAFVPQEPWLIDGTVAENIALGSPTTTRAAVGAAARRAGVETFTREWPDGLDAPVGEGGHLLSGGQQRRVAIARAIVSGAALLLVDEPTAALDPAARAGVLDALIEAARQRTAVIVTHDPSVVQLADHLVELWPPLAHEHEQEEVNNHVDQDQPHRRNGQAPRGPDPYAHAHAHA